MMCGAYGDLSEVSEEQKGYVKQFRHDLEKKLQERMNIALTPDLEQVKFVGSKKQVVAGTNHQILMEVSGTKITMIIFEKLPCNADGNPVELSMIEVEW